MSRLSDLKDFYALLDRLEEAVGGRRLLSDCTAGSGWPERGVYFFFEAGEVRSDTGEGSRVVRVGTHALAPDAGTKLWDRLGAHRGPASTGGGNHRGSIFRSLVGAALAVHQPDLVVSSWGVKPAPPLARDNELPLEKRVSGLIRAMPFLWVAIPDAAAYGQRARIETNAIALLSNFKRPALDSPSPSWLGHHCDRELVRSSGLWLNDDVEKTHDPAFLDEFEALVAAMERG